MNKLRAIVGHVCALQSRRIVDMWYALRPTDATDTLVVQFEDRWLELDGGLMFVDSEHAEKIVMFEVAALFKVQNLGTRERQ